MPDHLKTKTKKSRAGLQRKMAKRGFTLVSTSPSGKTSRKAGTSKGKVVKTLSRTSTFTKPRKRKPPKSRAMF